MDSVGIGFSLKPLNHIRPGPKESSNTKLAIWTDVIDFSSGSSAFVHTIQFVFNDCSVNYNRTWTRICLIM